MKNDIREKTVKNFDDQWKIHRHGTLTTDYQGSESMLKDYFGDFFNLNSVKGSIIAEVGCGPGRFVNTFMKHNPKKMYAIDPSARACDHVKKNFPFTNLSVINSYGHNFKTDELCDFIFSLGVIHHIKDPDDVFINIRNHLKNNGKFIIWVYGYENNQLYYSVYRFLSFFTKKMPDFLLNFLSFLLNLILVPYIFLCKYLNLPLKNYFIKVFSLCSMKTRKEIIFDQLNPTYAKYYRKQEIEKELIKGGFINLKFYHRHGYSWTVIAEK